MKGKAVFLAMLLSVLLAGRAEAQRCLPKMRGIEMKAGMTGADGYWLGAALSSYARGSNKWVYGAEYLQMQPSVQERECSRGTVHGGGRFPIQLPVGCEKDSVLLRGGVSPCRIRVR